MTKWRIRFLAGALCIAALCRSAQAISTTIVISQIYSSQNIGRPEGPRLRNDFIELFNRGNTTVNLSGWSLQVSPDTGTSWQKITLSGSIAPGQYYLVQTAPGLGRASLPQPDATAPLVRVEALGGGVALVNNDTLLGTTCPVFSTDFVSYGSASGCGNAAPALDSLNGLIRARGGCLETDGGEFTSVTPYPRNTSSPRNVCGATSAPALRSFAVPASGGVSLQTTGTQSTLGIGHIRIQPSGSSTTPAGLAIFSLRQGQTLLSEATVPAAPLIRSGQLYAEVNGPINTGVAISNPNNEEASIAFQLVDSGRGFATQFGNLIVPANGQIARFVNELPYSLITPVQGTLLFTATAPIAVIALRGFTNERGEFLVTTVPPVDESAAPSSAELAFPHMADSAGYTTQFVLFGSTGQASSGNLRLLSTGGEPLTVEFRP